jgi:hypothetical protein
MPNSAVASSLRFFTVKGLLFLQLRQVAESAWLG